MKLSFVKTAYIAGLVATLTGVAVQARATQPTVIETPVSNRPSAIVTEYKIAPGDVIGISVPNFTDPNLNSQVTIPPDGRITLALINDVMAAGKTTSQLQQELTKKWNEYVVDPAVSVVLIQKHIDHVTVSGYVVHPGEIDFRPPLRLSQAIGAAGGGLPNGDLHKVFLTRSSGDREVVDLSRPDLTTGTDADVLLDVNDSVYIPEKRTVVSVVGEVKEPGSFDYKDNMTVLELLTVAGGVLPDIADLHGSSITHDGRVQPLDLYALIKNGDMSANIKLIAGDVLTIPEYRSRIYVYGEVRQPGFYLYHPNDRMLDALNGVGGPLPTADLDKVNLIHIAADKKTAVFEKIDLGKYLKVGDVSVNREVQPGDSLYVPSKSQKFSLRDLWIPLQGMNLLSAGARVVGGL